MNSQQIATHFEEIGNRIWCELGKAFENESWLDWDGLPDEVLEEMTAEGAQRTILGQGLRGLANSCFNLAETVRSKSQLIDCSKAAQGHYTRTADFTDKYAQKLLRQFRDYEDGMTSD